MAAVVSHAMRRFPTTPPDTSYSSYASFRGESSSVDGESALSRSMRYADPWLYGSVRAPGGFYLTPAFVLCACPDYINGTKKSSKKGTTTCKKCKGTRIPISPSEPTKYGTVRYFSTEVPTSSTTPLRGGTVRVTSSKRASILPSEDPYDIVRKSRLSVTDGLNQLRTRSVSPSKATDLELKNKNSGKSKDEKRIDSYNLTIGRRSILECDINPYELVSTGNSTFKEGGITFVNGQRIRVRPSVTDTDFQDVQLRLSTPTKPSNAKPSKLGLIGALSKATSPILKENRFSEKNESPKFRAKNEYASPKQRENELNQKFKSILKRTTESSPSPTPEKGTGGSQFYIPLPNSKKKVQFLVSNDLESSVENITKELVEKDSESEDGNSMEDIRTEGKGNNLPHKSILLYRSLSDRAKKGESKIKFYDTTALRQFKHRKSLKIVFSDLERLDGINQKIKKINANASETCKDGRHNKEENENETDNLKENFQNNEIQSLNNLNHLIENRDVRLEPPIEVENLHKNEILVSVLQNQVESMVILDPFVKLENTPKRQDEELALAKLDKCINENIDGTIIPVDNTPPAAPPRKRSINKQNGISTVRLESANVDNLNKTVLKITTSSDVHKIQIRNEFSDTADYQSYRNPENAERKTSILINGDNCYSTVNVNDDIPLYQSSVVVKDSITDEMTIKTEKSEKQCSMIYITSPVIENRPKESKNLTEQESNTKDTDATPPVGGDSEMLRELLRDPVEAVRRNLVPHVCGKSDVFRRRDKKFLNDKSLNLSIDMLPDPPYEELPLISKYEPIYDDISSDLSSSTQYELIDHGSDCYTDHSNRSSVTEEELASRTKFYELLADSGVIEVSEPDEHIYECIKVNDNDPIYEAIEEPPPLPNNPPPTSILDDIKLDKEFTTRSIFEGASKYDILSYLVDAKERGVVQEDCYTYFTPNGTNEDDIPISQLSTVSDSSEDNSVIVSASLIDDKTTSQKGAEVERNDSGVGSETSKSSLSKYRSKQEIFALCEDCEITLEASTGNLTLLCRKCLKKRSERKEIITEIVETEEKYSKDLQIILEEFYQPMLVAGLLTPDQLSTIFLNVEELLENSQALAEKLRDAVEIASEQGDEDLLTVNIGKMFLESMAMLHAFETYCVRQGAASLLLASLEKEKELLRIFLRVSQMENTMLRRMNLNSFLMVPVQRVTKYPLLLARLFKVTPAHYDYKEDLKEAQHKIELHLNHMNSQTKDVPSKLWRRIGSSSGRRSSNEMDLVNIKLRKIAVDVLEWNHEEAKFVLEGKLLFTQPTDNNWRKGRTIKLSPVNAMLVISGKPSSTKIAEENSLVFSKHTVREAALLLVRDKNGRYSLLREPLYLDRCVIAADPAWQSYFEVQELLGKDTFIFKAEDEEQTNMWFKQLQYHAQGMGTWRKRRNALANIMINGMGLRS